MGWAALTVISEWELWACAQQVLKQHGARAPEHIERRVTELATATDEKGVQTWVAIADRLDQLADGSGLGRARH